MRAAGASGGAPSNPQQPRCHCRRPSISQHRRGFWWRLSTLHPPRLNDFPLHLHDTHEPPPPALAPPPLSPSHAMSTTCCGAEHAPVTQRGPRRGIAGATRPPQRRSAVAPSTQVRVCVCGTALRHRPSGGRRSRGGTRVSSCSAHVQRPPKPAGAGAAARPSPAHTARRIPTTPPQPLPQPFAPPALRRLASPVTGAAPPRDRAVEVGVRQARYRAPRASPHPPSRPAATAHVLTVSEQRSGSFVCAFARQQCLRWPLEAQRFGQADIDARAQSPLVKACLKLPQVAWRGGVRSIAPPHLIASAQPAAVN